LIDRAQILEAVEAAYQDVKRTSRNLRGSERLYDDLDIDSLDAMELLTRLEDERGVDLVNDPRTAHLKTVDDLLDLLQEVVPDTVAAGGPGR
jgi:acyl carrier protein